MLENPILVMDSGLGGLTVLKKLRMLLPQESYVYFGDVKFAPYGIKSTEEVRSRTLSVIDTLVRTYQPKAIVIACNTATSAAIIDLRTRYASIPVIGTEPALKPAVEYIENLMVPDAKILVMATPVTLREEKFEKLLSRFSNRVHIDLLAAPELVQIVEDGTDWQFKAKTYLKSLISRFSLNLPYQAVVLGCTHFPFVRHAIQNVFGESAKLFDSSLGVARRVQDQLSSFKCSDNSCDCRFICSDEKRQDSFESKCKELMTSLE